MPLFGRRRYPWPRKAGELFSHGRLPRRTWWLPCLLGLLILACGSEGESPGEQAQEEPRKESLWVRHILIRKAGAPGAGPETRSRASADSLAQALLRRIEAGEDFRRLAKEYSEDPSSVDGGEIAPLEPNEAPPEFLEVARALQPGQVSGVVETPMGFHIIQRRDMSRCTAQHILVRYKGAHSAPDSIVRSREEALGLAEHILAEVRHPDASFPVAARIYSEDTQTASQGGYLGSFLRGKMDPRFEAAAFALQEGEISDVVETPYGFHIIRRISPNRIRVAHILVTYAGLGQLVEEQRTREEALQRALDAAFRAKQGEDFAELVAEYSDDAHTGKRGGILPPLRAGQTVPEFEDAAFHLKPGEVSEVVETEFGFHVIKRLW